MNLGYIAGPSSFKIKGGESQPGAALESAAIGLKKSNDAAVYPWRKLGGTGTSKAAFPKKQ